MAAAPQLLRPRASSIHASFPMALGQNSSDGQKKTRRAYRLWSPPGSAVVNAL